MNRQRRTYCGKCKQEAIALVVEHGYRDAAAGRNLGVTGNMIRREEAGMEGHGSEAFPGKRKRTVDQPRIHDLEKENRRLRMDKEISRKATALFAMESP